MHNFQDFLGVRKYNSVLAMLLQINVFVWFTETRALHSIQILSEKRNLNECEALFKMRKKKNKKKKKKHILNSLLLRLNFSWLKG